MAMGEAQRKNGRGNSSHADLTELVSSQAKVMLAGIDTLWHCSALPRHGNPTKLDLANVRATRRTTGEWAVAWGVRNFILSPHSILITTITRDIKRIFRPHRFCQPGSPAMQSRRRREVINLLAQANPQTFCTVLRPQACLAAR